MFRPALLALVASLATVGSVSAAGTVYEVAYPAPETPKAGELPYAVTYRLWVPDGVKHIRGVIVHQHGCGTGACKGGATAARDLHWQALAKKWDCALLGPEYHQPDKADCRQWCDPRNGSGATFLRCLTDFAKQSKHPEIETAPWCLWGHSGGGFWASLMQTQHPERIVAIWFRSGTAFATWEKGDIKKPTIPDAAYAIPIVLNPGAKEKDHKQFAGAWTGAVAMFQAYRAKGSPACFAPDPRTGHECGDSRYLAIPFFDACLAARLPAKEDLGGKLRPIDQKAGFLAKFQGDAAVPAEKFDGKPEEACWLPTESVAKAWGEYVRTGSTIDTTAPPTPTNVVARVLPTGGVEITWEADADFESGIRGFVIERDGKELAAVPSKPVGKFGRPLFQVMSYHDTPEAPVPEMKLLDKDGKAGSEYRVVVVNGVGLKSEPAQVTAK